MGRIARWKRASSFGLNPPAMVECILTTWPELQESNNWKHLQPQVPAAVWLVII
jgi:hypothetical protein